MAQKKCSKCGELNPPEAVMCWACYTPLSGAGVPATASAGAAYHASHSGSEAATAKKAPSSTQLGVIGLGVLIAVVMGARAMMGGTDNSTVVETVAAAPPTSVPDSTSQQPPPTVIAGLSSSGGGSGVSSGITPTAVPQPGKMSFTISLPPKRGVAWTTMAIVPTDANITPQAAASLAAAARQQLAATGKWKGMYIYVFSDQTSAARLRAFQADRAGAPLKQSDYQTLSAIWPRTLARYEYSKGWEAIRYPATNPSGWWQGQSKYGKATL